MEFITVEQFKEQPKEVQEVFLDWYNFDKYDLFYLKWEGAEKKWGATEEIVSGATLNRHLKHLKRANSNIINTIPLFTEGQLRKFIEDKTGGKVDASFGGKTYTVYSNKDFGLIIKMYEDIDSDLLQAYWKVACMVAKEEVDE
ncbi:hypothetical protein [Clostridium sp.]|uniref:hypothetical protein n=1 Tax=Clostridium sp. TaxID=1506 RepID=UPI00290D1C12|nr:hypothetical protein [Clostridium sp.]MDU7243247.1 hypothetical protein [Clostridium sp.]